MLACGKFTHNCQKALRGRLERSSRNPADLNLCGPLEQFAGCLYVLEGATLGGQVILRHLRKRLNLTTRDGTAFFAGEGASTGARWKRVLEWLELVARSDIQAEQMVASARETFSALTNWALTRGGPHEY